MTRAEVEQFVVRNHDGLEELIDELEQIANRFLTGDPAAEPELRSLSLEVATQLQRHLTFEERHWYPHLLTRLTTRQFARNEVQHLKQRRCIDLVRNHAHSAPAGAFVDCIVNLIHHFRRHTRRENVLLAI